MNFSLQFIPVEQRDELINKIFNSLLPGGVLILSEKIFSDSDFEDDATTQLHFQMKKMNGALNVEDVAELREDIEEQQQMGDEVSNLLSEGIGFTADMDEDELEAELAALSDGEHNEEIANVLSKAPNAPVVAPMPVAPTNEVTITTGDSDEDMLAQLQAEFA